MAETATDREMNKMLFTQLVMLLSSSAMQQLGKLVNPVTRKAAVDLEGAQATIDMLAMLREKTRGNLDKDEAEMLNGLLSSLQMNYVETAEAAAAGPAPGKPAASAEAAPAGPAEGEAAKEGAGEETPKTPDPPSPPDAAGSPKKNPKYHKTYGA